MSPRTTNMKLRADHIVTAAAQSNHDGRGSSDPLSISECAYQRLDSSHKDWSCMPCF
jgi:hypothetical protein